MLVSLYHCIVQLQTRMSTLKPFIFGGIASLTAEVGKRLGLFMSLCGVLLGWENGGYFSKSTCLFKKATEDSASGIFNSKFPPKVLDNQLEKILCCALQVGSQGALPGKPKQYPVLLCAVSTCAIQPLELLLCPVYTMVEPNLGFGGCLRE